MTSLNTLVQQNIQNENVEQLLEHTPVFALDYYDAGEGLDADQEDDMPSADIMLGSVPVPDDNCCYLFQHHNYGGGRREVCHSGKEKTIHLYDDPWNFNDTAGSFSCGRNTIFTMCDNEMWRCAHKNASSGQVRNPDIGDWMDDKLTSIKIEPYNHTVNGAVNIFNAYDCAGMVATFWNKNTSGTAWTEWDMEHWGLPKDTASSIQVPGGFVVDLYTSDGLRGSKKQIYGFTDPDGQMPCINLKDFNNRVSSLEIRQIKHGSAIGYWDGITATETQSFKYTVGVVQQNGQEASSEQRSAINSSMELGFEFMGGSGATYSIGASYEKLLRRSVTETSTISSIRERSTTCTAKDKEGTGLWQWIVRTEDGEILAKDQHTVCKSGDGYNKSPRCPWNACKNGDCTECEQGWTYN